MAGEYWRRCDNTLISKLLDKVHPHSTVVRIVGQEGYRRLKSSPLFLDVNDPINQEVVRRINVFVPRPEHAGYIGWLVKLDGGAAELVVLEDSFVGALTDGFSER